MWKTTNPVGQVLDVHPRLKGGASVKAIARTSKAAEKNIVDAAVAIRAHVTENVMPAPTVEQVRESRRATNGDWSDWASGEIEPIDFIRAASAKQRRGGE